MGFNTTVVHEYFRRNLSEAGYPTTDIRFSLSNVQGDGVAFYGGVSLASATVLANRLLSKLWRKWALDGIQAYKADGASAVFLIKKISNTCDHAYTMRGEFCIDPQDVVGLSERSEYALRMLLQKLEDDIPRVSNLLDRRGYAILDATFDDSVRQFKTKNYSIKVRQCADEHFNPFLLDQTKGEWLAESFATGECGFCALEVLIEDQESASEIARTLVRGIEFKRREPDVHKRYGGQVRKAIEAAIKEVRLN